MTGKQTDEKPPLIFVSDEEAQLWQRIYASVYALLVMRQEGYTDYHGSAHEAADRAVLEFRRRVG